MKRERKESKAGTRGAVQESPLHATESLSSEVPPAQPTREGPYQPKGDPPKIDVSMIPDEEGSEEKEADFEGHVIDAFKPVHKALGEALGKLEEHGISAIVRFNAKLGILMVVLDVPEEAIIWEGEKSSLDQKAEEARRGLALGEGRNRRKGKGE